MKRRPLLIFALLYVFFLSLAFLAGFAAHAGLASAALPGLPGASTFPLVDEALELLRTRFISRLPEDKVLEYGALRGLVSAVGDPYTVFLEPTAHQLEAQSLQGEYGGIGVSLRRSDQGETLLSPLSGSPALEAGIQEGDVLLAVDGQAVTPEVGLDQVAAWLRGLVDTQVEVRLRHPGGETLSLSLTRRNIPLPSVTWRLVDGQPDIGLIAVERFTGKTAEEVQRAGQALLAQGATRLVLDLRNNGGGILEAAVAVAGTFLDGGVVMFETQRGAPEKTYTAPRSDSPLTRLPLAVLVNGNTASAAEIVAGALLDRGRAPLIGQTTYGKGSVQLVFQLSDGSSLHITSFLWYTPGRRALDRAGLPPTISVEPAVDGTDAELRRAVEVLREQP